MCDGCGCEQAGGAVIGLEGQRRKVRVEEDLLAENLRVAAENRAYFHRHRLLAVNLLSSPGSGKTTLLEQTIQRLPPDWPVAVIEGDQQTSRDAERIEATGAPAVQVNTGAGCHLDARMIHRALHELKPAAGSLLVIENVGNLVCPAMFDLGETAKVVVISVTEGEDKPLKYPHIFAAASLCLINKIDLLPFLDFDLEGCRRFVRQVNPDLACLPLSAQSGQGMASWLDWLADRRPAGC